jgi:hypothetical protein
VLRSISPGVSALGRSPGDDVLAGFEVPVASFFEE